MGPYRSLFVFTDSNSSPLVLIRRYGFKMGSYRLLCIILGPYRLLCIIVGPYGSLMFLIRPYDSNGAL